MEKAQETNYLNLASKHFGHGRKHYFIDVKRAANDSHFLLITSSERFRGDEQYYRQTVQLWEEDLAIFVDGLSMVLRRLTHGDLTLILNIPSQAGLRKRFWISLP